MMSAECGDHRAGTAVSGVATGTYSALRCYIVEKLNCHGARVSDRLVPLTTPPEL